MNKSEFQKIFNEMVSPIRKDIAELRQAVAPSGPIGELLQGIEAVKAQLQEITKIKAENAAASKTGLRGVFSGLGTIGEHRTIDPSNPFRGIIFDPTRKPVAAAKGEENELPDAMSTALANPEMLKKQRDGSDLEDSSLDIFFGTGIQ